MTLLISGALRLAVVAAVTSAFDPNAASAQTAAIPAHSSVLSLGSTVPAGAVVHVTDVHGKTLTGVFGRVTSDVVEIIVRGQIRAVFARDVQRIRWRQPDSWATGAMIGAGIGAIPGIYYLITDPNECSGLCPEEYALVGIGALVGALVDKAITKKVTVYDKAAAGGTRGKAALTPVLSRGRRGVQVRVSF